MKRALYLIFGVFCVIVTGEVFAQSFKFAHVTDTHIGGKTAADDLRRTIQDINQNPEIKFVLITGDVTEFGSDEELTLAKQILDSLARPWYIVPGNHDANWSESGGNSFREVFGAETFEFKYNGYQFIGTNSGPNMRMSPGQVPRENLVWMDSVFNAEPDSKMPLIFINHYPLDDGLNNWYEVIDRLKTRNIQLALCGHGHNNRVMDFEGIPGVMGRSNLRAKDSVGAYNIVTIKNDKAIYATRIPGVKTNEPWTTITLENHYFDTKDEVWIRPQLSTRKNSDGVIVEWEYQDDSDLGTGLAIYKDLAITANTMGEVYALDLKDGTKKWSFQSRGKIYSTPTVAGNSVVVGSSDGNIYCLDARNGQEIWRFKTDKAVLGSPVVVRKTVYIGGSDGHFRALNLKDGSLEWDFDGVENFISSTPLFYKGTLYFGSWGNGFYALDAKTGELKWEWDNGYTNRMLSAAAVVPVEAHDRVFVVAPDRYMTALDAATGNVIWREKKDSIRVRESIGLAKDGEKVYVKTMDGDLLGVSTRANDMEVIWESALDLPYELTPSAIVERNGLVFVPSHSGLVSAVDATSGEVEWQYKISNAMVNPIKPLEKNKVLVSSMDGTIFCLKYH